jgi:outer membrane putative beta-barrel porin/alpha-amylase
LEVAWADYTRLKMLSKQIAGVALCLGCMPALAAEPIDTDGPDFVESSEAVGEGRFQYETHLQLERDDGNGTRTTTTSTPTLLKYGITQTVELRVETEGYVRAVEESGGTKTSTTGTGDTAFGLKWHSQDRDAARNRPAIAWILHFDVPTGADEFDGRGVRPSLRSVLTWDLPRDFTFGLMPGIRYDSADDGHRFASGILGVVLNRRFTANFRAFVELSVPQIARARDGGTIATWDVGAAYLLTNDTQLGARGGVAANRNTPDLFLLLELAQRF